LSAVDDDIDRGLWPNDEGDEPSWPGPDNRVGLEAGAGLEIEDDTAPADSAGLRSDFEADVETPSWLNAGRSSEDSAGQGVSYEDELESEAGVLPEGITPSWLEIDAEFLAEESGTGSESEAYAGEDGEGQDPDIAEGSRQKLLVVHESQRIRRTLIFLAVAAALICGISTYMFINGIGPFAPAVREEFPDGSETLPDGSVKDVEWATAGENYYDLFALISEQTRGALGSTGVDNNGQGDLILIGEDPSDIQQYYGDGKSYLTANDYAEGVREADVVKADDSHIYSINSNNLFIVRADGDELEIVSKIAQPSEDEKQVYFEMFVAGDRLIAVRQGLNNSALQKTPGMGDTGTPVMGIWYPFGGRILDTSIDIFDISDRSSPVKLHTLSQSGSYVNSRMVDGYLYLISTYYGDVSQMDGGYPETFVPLYARDGEQFLPDESDILIPPGSQWPCYTVITGIDVLGSGDFISLRSVYGDIGSLYASPGAVYLTRTAYEETKESAGVLQPLPGTDGQGLEYLEYMNWSDTLISKLKIDSGHVEPCAQARVPGYVLDQFSMDEYNGVLRLVTTVDFNIWYGFKNSRGTYNADDWARLPPGAMEMSNALYTLDEELHPLGVIEDIAPNERVFSGRFMDDVAYITMYRQTNPFSIGLSDPASPKVIGTLTISGFSDYLRSFAKGRLFGFGRSIDPATGIRKGLKLTMFDSSDPAYVAELHVLTIDDEHSVADYNYRAIMVSAENAFVGFPIFDRYMIYGYDDATGFKKITDMAFENDDSAWTEVRGLFIGDKFYVVAPNTIYAYAMDKDFEQIGSLRMDEGANSVDRWSFGGPVDIVPLPEPLPPLPDGTIIDPLE